MAKKNFKNNGVMGVCALVANFVWKNALRWIVAGAICVLWTLGCIVLMITSPLWFPICAVKAPETTAVSINSSFSKYKGEEVLFIIYLYIVYIFVMRACGWLYAPLIRMLPMKYRAEFIRNGKKHVCEYPAKVQIAYYKSHDKGGKQSLIASGAFSIEVREALWKDNTERKNWIKTGMELTPKQIEDLCRDNTDQLLWGYFKSRTPNKEVYDLLLEYVREGYSAPAATIIKLIRQQRPKADLIGKLLCTQNDSFIARVNEVIDWYGDMDAVEFGTRSISDDVSDEEKQRIIGERWTNFCKSKKDISPDAQKKMGHAQYRIFVETGHKLEYYAMQHLCLSLAQGQRDYLLEIITNEFERIDKKLQTALKADYWRYSAYLAVKEARYAKKKA